MLVAERYADLSPAVAGLAGVADVLKGEPVRGVLQAGHGPQACCRLDVGDRAVQVGPAAEHRPDHRPPAGRPGDVRDRPPDPLTRQVSGPLTRR